MASSSFAVVLNQELKAAIAAATPEEQKKLADALKALEGRQKGHRDIGFCY